MKWSNLADRIGQCPHCGTGIRFYGHFEYGLWTRETETDPDWCDCPLTEEEREDIEMRSEFE